MDYNDYRELADMLISSMEDTEPKGTYVALKVLNSVELSSWFQRQGMEVVQPDELHVTLAYSRTEFNHRVNEEPILVKPDQYYHKLETLGDEGVIVLKFTNEEVNNRFQQCMDEGATYDYPKYQPHVTITYKGTGLNLDEIEVPNFSLVLGNEHTNVLDHNWEDKIKEYKE